MPSLNWISKEGHAWGDMAVLCARVLHERKLPPENRLGAGDFDPASDKIKVKQEGQQRPGVPRGGDAGDAEAGDWGGWGWGIWAEVGKLKSIYVQIER